MTLHLELSIMMGTRAISGSVAMRLRNVVMACSESSRPSSMLTSITWAPLVDLLARDGERGLVVVGLDELAEFGRAGDVGPLADIDEGGCCGE